MIASADGEVLHCFAAIIPTKSDLKIEQIYEFTKQTDAFESIDFDYSRIFPERMKRKLFEPKRRPKVEVDRPYLTAEEGPSKPERDGAKTDVVEYASKASPEHLSHPAFGKVRHNNNNTRSIQLDDGSVVTKVMRPQYHSVNKSYNTMFLVDESLTYDVFVWAVNVCGFGPVSHSHEQSAAEGATRKFDIPLRAGFKCLNLEEGPMLDDIAEYERQNQVN